VATTSPPIKLPPASALIVIKSGSK
jgi:hypothetical protein